MPSSIYGFTSGSCLSWARCRSISEGFFPSRPQNTLLWSHPAMAPPDPADPADPTDLIAALTAALVKLLLNQPSILLVTPFFDWNTMEQYDDFQLLCKSVESWFTLQNIPVETAPGAGPDVEPDSTWLEYVLNFLWQYRPQEIWLMEANWHSWWDSKEEKQASAFMDYLSSMMDHAVSQCCRIYQLFASNPNPSLQLDKLIDYLCALADWYNFPSDEEKEWNIQYRLIRALNDKELVKKLLTLDLKATTPKMLEVCQTHITISDNLEAMGLKEQKTVNAIRKWNKPHQGMKPPADSVHSCGHYTKSHPPGQSSCPAWDDICHRCGKKGCWKPKCQSGHKEPKDKAPKYISQQRRKTEEGQWSWNWWRPHCDEVGIVTVVLQTSPHIEWLTARHKRRGADPETFEISDVQIDSTKEAFATIQMPAEIGPSQLVTLKCKVDTGAGGNVTPLCTFTKLFPRSINADGSPRGQKSSTTCLTAYNGSKVPQFRTLDTAIDWTPKGQKVANHLQTQWYIVDTPGPAILGLPSCAKLGIVELNCAVNLQKKEVGAAEETHNRMQNSQTEPLRSEPPPLNTKEDLIKAYLDRFEGIGHFPGTYHITLCSDAKPIVHAPWKCLIAMQPLV